MGKGITLGTTSDGSLGINQMKTLAPLHVIVHWFMKRVK